jgi:hypothetical protein
MTNIELLAKIKAEIERRIKELSEAESDYREEGCDSISAFLISGISELQKILSFLSTLESEKPMNQDGLDEETVRIEFHTIADKCFNEGIEGWEREKLIALHFAKWGAEHLADARKTSPRDLEEAADEYEKKHTYQRYDGGGFTPEYDATLAEAVIFGAKWQKEQMIKDAISCKVFWHDGPLLDYTQEQQDNALERIGANVGDKVKIIIIKEG